MDTGSVGCTLGIADIGGYLKRQGHVTMSKGAVPYRKIDSCRAGGGRNLISVPSLGCGA